MGLGVTLHDEGELDQAMAAGRRAIELDPKVALAHYNLGRTLNRTGNLDAAVAEFRQAIELDPKHFRAHGALGMALMQRGRYSEAREATARAVDLIPKGDPLLRMATDQLQRCARLAELDERLPDFESGKAQPADGTEWLALAEICKYHRRRHALAARFYSGAFTADPKLIADPLEEHRFNAACCAALASGESANRAADPLDQQRTRWRQQALAWLRADLTQYDEMARQKSKKIKLIASELVIWQHAADLAAVRDKQTLDHLPSDEQTQWRDLWSAVSELVKQIRR